MKLKFTILCLFIAFIQATVKAETPTRSNYGNGKDATIYWKNKNSKNTNTDNSSTKTQKTSVQKTNNGVKPTVKTSTSTKTEVKPTSTDTIKLTKPTDLKSNEQVSKSSFDTVIVGLVDSRPENHLKNVLYISNPSEEQRIHGFVDNDKHQSITFLLDLAAWGFTFDPSSILTIGGSFNGWNPYDERFILQKKQGDRHDDGVFYYVTCPYELINVPGQSGLPEFNFSINGKFVDLADFVGDDFITTNNNSTVILSFSQSDNNIVIPVQLAKSGKIKQISDFDMKSEKGKSQLANFRNVAGLSKLYRSYHPYKVSMKQSSTEEERIGAVNELMELKGVKSLINVSTNERNGLKDVIVDGVAYREKLSNYYKSIPVSSILYVGDTMEISPSYYEVYYNSSSDYFHSWIKEIVEFIISPEHEAPFLMYSRLGIDRTGVMSAVLAGLCGADWNAIAVDYEKSNDMGIRENRHRNMLRYSLSQIIGKDVFKVNNIKEELSSAFIKRGILSQEQIDALAKKLK